MTTTVEPPIQLVRRTARVTPPSAPEGAITVSAPPDVASAPAGAAGWLQYVFPIVESLGGMLFIVNNPKPLFLASGLLFMMGSIGMGVGMGVQQRLAARRRVQAARANYLDYLAGLRTELQATAAAQRALSRWRHPLPDALVSMIRSPPVRLWERRPEDVDFLQLRLGQGRQPLATALELPVEKGPAQAGDPVCVAAADHLVQAHGWVADDALGIDLRAARGVSILGPRTVRSDVARALLCQIAVLHAPDDVQVLLCASATSAPDWEWIKWLPHLHRNGDSAPGIVDDPAELDALVLARVARARKVQAGVELIDSGPWLVVLTDGILPTPDAVASLRRASCRTTLVSLGDRPAEEPAAVDLRVLVTPDRLSLERLGAPGPPVDGRADRLGRQ